MTERQSGAIFPEFLKWGGKTSRLARCRAEAATASDFLEQRNKLHDSMIPVLSNDLFIGFRNVHGCTGQDAPFVSIVRDDSNLL